jgi:hypothetical protein
MANRTVSVELQAKVAPFVSEIRSAEGAASDLNDELTDLGKHDREMAGLEAAAVSLTAAVKETAKAADDLGDEVDGAGDKMGGTAAKAHFLAMELAKARREAEELAVVLRAGGGDADVLKQYRTATGKVTRLESAAKRLGLDGEGGDDSFAKAGGKAGKAFTGGFRTAVKGSEGIGWSTLGVFTDPVILALAIPAVALAGAEIGGVFGGAVVAGIGAAGIGAGVAAAFQDPRVQLAGQGLVASFGELAHEVGAEFSGPTREGIHILRAEVEKLTPQLRATAQALAPATTGLAHGLADAMDVFAEKMQEVLINSKPLIEWLGNELPDVAGDVGDLLVEMSEHADEARFALNIFFVWIDAGLKTLEALTVVGAKVIDILEGVTHALQKIPAVDRLGDLTGHLDTFDKTVDEEAIPSLAELAKQLNATALTADQLAGAMADKMFNSLLAADHATLSLHQSQLSLTESLKENGKHLELNSEKGLSNRQAILSVVQANIQMYDTMIAAGHSATDAASAYNDNTAALEAQLRKAGIAQKEIDGLIGKYRQVPNKVNTEIAMEGLAKAINDLADLIRQINGIDRHIDIDIVERRVVRGQATYERWGGVHYAADGLVSFGQAGIYSGGPVYGIAEPETGGEAFVPRHGDYARSMGILSEAASWYGAAVQPLARSRAAAGIWPAGGASGAAGDDHSVHLTVQAARANLDYSELQAWQRNAEIRQRVGRPR